MKLKQRLIKDFDFPEYAYIPGIFPHPNKIGGHSFGKKEPIVDELDPYNVNISKAYLYAFDLYNHGFFWESHVWWEALWNKAGRKGESADFIKGLIKLAASGVKIYLKQLCLNKLFCINNHSS